MTLWGGLITAPPPPPIENTHLVFSVNFLWESVNSGLDYWNGLLDWTTGLTFDLKFSYEMGDFACPGCKINSYKSQDVIGGEPGGFTCNSVCVR